MILIKSGHLVADKRLIIYTSKIFVLVLVICFNTLSSFAEFQTAIDVEICNRVPLTTEQLIQFIFT